MHVEPIDPDGGDDPQNLCLSCSNCNFSKGIATRAHDPVTQTDVPLFNPRTELWKAHFEWIDGGLRLAGKTPIGRATILRLKMNQPRVIRARENWILSKTHPPE